MIPASMALRVLINKRVLINNNAVYCIELDDDSCKDGTESVN